MSESLSPIAQTRDTQRDQINDLQGKQREAIQNHDQTVHDLTKLTQHMRALRDSVSGHFEDIWEAISKGKGKGKDKGKGKSNDN